jgi:hypothetical protein
MVMTTELYEEWDIEASTWARRWLVAMVQKAKVVRVEVPSGESVRDCLMEKGLAEKAINEAIDDAHLLFAATQTDRRVISLDDAVRAIFTEAHACLKVGAVVWVNPDRGAEDVVGWLRAGAPPDKHRRLRASR